MGRLLYMEESMLINCLPSVCVHDETSDDTRVSIKNDHNNFDIMVKSFNQTRLK